MRRLASLSLSLIVAAAAAAGGCSGSPTGPSWDAPIRVSLTPLPTFVGSPNAAAFAATVANVTTGAVELTFPSSCQLLPYFTDGVTGRPVTPLGGGSACATVITHLTLQPSMSMTQPIMVKAGTAPEPNAIVLPPGD